MFDLFHFAVLLIGDVSFCGFALVSADYLLCLVAMLLCACLNVVGWCYVELFVFCWR